ncbi:S1 family peptidase (plasmid) [Rhizobium johnstonii]|nr:S1 family peptidase [Rhizobium johnstonii]
MIVWARLLGVLLVALSATNETALSQTAEPEIRVRYGQVAQTSPEAGDATISADRETVAAIKAASPPNLETRIANGDDVDLINFAEVVKISFSDEHGRHGCTGVLLSPDVILTAGHCGCGWGYEAAIQKLPMGTGGALAKLKVRGGPDLFPGYNCSDRSRTGVGRDLSVLRIEPLQATSRKDTFELEGIGVAIRFPVIRPGIQVLSDRSLRSLFIVGFGRTETGEAARNLQGANVGLLSRHCAAARVFLSACARFREFAMGRRPNAPGVSPDSCGGDSGGPAYRMDSDLVLDKEATIIRLSRRTLVGIVSRALNGVVHPYLGYCGGGGIYTTVGTRPVLEWLRKQKVAFSYDSRPVYIPDQGD